MAVITPIGNDVALGLAGAWMRKGFIVSSGTGIKDRRERRGSASEALKLVLLHMRLRRPNVTIEDESEMPVSFFRLKEMAALEDRKENAHRS
jgi:hypothetical protein